MVSEIPHTLGGEWELTVDAKTFRDVMARIPSCVTIVTTRDESGQPWGFTASSFCSVSLEPPLVLVCLAVSATCFPVFSRCQELAISALQPQHAELARRFATKSPDKFGGAPLRRLPSGIDAVEGALAVLECQVWGRTAAGDHMIIIGQVRHAQVCADAVPAVYVDRFFTTVGPLNNGGR